MRSRLALTELHGEPGCGEHGRRLMDPPCHHKPVARDVMARFRRKVRTDVQGSRLALFTVLEVLYKLRNQFLLVRVAI